MLTTVIPIALPETGETVDLVEQILEQLEPLIARQRGAVARHGCLRAISSTHLHVLYLLETEGPMPMGRLAELLCVSLPNVTGIVDRMAERGFVERGRDEDDRRVVTLTVTASGRETVEEIDQIRRVTLAKTLSRLTVDQQVRALQTFTEMRAAMEAIDDSEPHLHARPMTTQQSNKNHQPTNQSTN